MDPDNARRLFVQRLPERAIAGFPAESGLRASLARIDLLAAVEDGEQPRLTTVAEVDWSTGSPRLLDGPRPAQHLVGLNLARERQAMDRLAAGAIS